MTAMDSLHNLLDMVGGASWSLGIAPNAELITGPLHKFQTSQPQMIVTVVQPDDILPGLEGETVHIKENAQEFDITYYDFDGGRGVFHHRGQNWIVWTDDLKHVFVSAGRESGPITWVRVRFVLRHFIVARLMAQHGYRRIHAVAGELADSTGLMIAGPYLSGKTFLLEHLIREGVVSALVEDDCAVISPEWQLDCLIPQEHTLQQTRHLNIRAVVCLDKTVQNPQRITPIEAANWAFPIQASWPLSWLPGSAPIDTRVNHIPTRLQCLRLPEKPLLAQATSEIRHVLKD